VIGARALDQHADAGVAADDVPLGGVVDAVAIGPNAVVRRSALDQYALGAVGDLGRAGGIGADEVAFDGVAGLGEAAEIEDRLNLGIAQSASVNGGLVDKTIQVESSGNVRAWCVRGATPVAELERR